MSWKWLIKHSWKITLANTILSFSLFFGIQDAVFLGTRLTGLVRSYGTMGIDYAVITVGGLLAVWFMLTFFAGIPLTVASCLAAYDASQNIKTVKQEPEN